MFRQQILVWLGIHYYGGLLTCITVGRNLSQKYCNIGSLDNRLETYV